MGLTHPSTHARVHTFQGINVQQNDLMRHNLVVFNGGQGALKVLPPLVDVIPEARLNLVIYYLKHDGIEEAFELLKGACVRPSHLACVGSASKHGGWAVVRPTDRLD